MKLFKRLLELVRGDHRSPKSFELLDKDEDDALIGFCVDGIDYSLLLDWEDGVLDIEFGLLNDDFLDTTNFNHQFELINTISHISNYMAKEIEKETKIPFHTISFKSSRIRNGKVDERSGEIRTKFFIRHIKKIFPNCEVELDKKNAVLIKMNRAYE